MCLCAAEKLPIHYKEPQNVIIWPEAFYKSIIMLWDFWCIEKSTRMSSLKLAVTLTTLWQWTQQINQSINQSITVCTHVRCCPLAIHNLHLPKCTFITKKNRTFSHPMTLIFELDLDVVKVTQHPKYIGQRFFLLKRYTHTHRYTPDWVLYLDH